MKNIRAITLAATLAACLGSTAAFGQSDNSSNMNTKRALAAADATPATTAGQPTMKWPPEKEGEARGSKVLVVLIYDQSCYYACKKVRPLIKELVPTYNGQVAYIEFNAAPDALSTSQKLAKDLHLSAFLTDSTNNVPLVGVFKGHRKLYRELQGALDKDSYKGVIDSALAQK